jgi:hypothetical protein
VAITTALTLSANEETAFQAHVWLKTGKFAGSADGKFQEGVVLVLFYVKFF